MIEEAMSLPEKVPVIRKFEIEEEIGERAKNLLPSQRSFIFAPERFSAISGGFGSGKSFAMVLKGTILSAAIPRNVGSLLCYHGTDVERRLVPLFMEEVCPRSWIKSWNKNKKVCVLKNGSVVSFDHIKDRTAASASGAATGRIGSSWGWFGVDQGEEILEEQWDALTSRIRLPRAPRKFGFMSLNPAGRDWCWKRFFQKVRPWPKDENGKALPIDGKYYQVLRQASNVLGVCVNSEENRISNGGFVEDSYFDSLLETYGAQWIERFVWGQFDDFKGQLFPDFRGGLVDYHDASVHVIDDFPIPRNWALTTGIDVGGDSPWAVVPVYADEQGNLIVANGFHNRTGRVSEVAQWIKRNLPWNDNRITFVLDPENTVATVELSDNGIYANPANKAINPGLLRMEGYLHVQKYRQLPHWYEETQSAEKFAKFRTKGSPKLFVFKSANVMRKELDTAKWDPEKVDKMYKSSTARFDACFVAGTLVRTGCGERAIETILPGVKVWTRKGLRAVKAAWCSNSQAEVVEARFSNGTRVKVTPNHRFLVNGKFMRIEAVSYGRVETWEENIHQSSFLMGCDSPSTKGSGIFGLVRLWSRVLRGRLFGCIALSGSTTTESLPPATKFTTGIKTPDITRFPIWSVLLQKNISGGISKMLRHLSRRPLFGTAPRREEGSPEKPVSRQTRCADGQIFPASIAEKNTEAECSVAGGTANSAAMPAKAQREERAAAITSPVSVSSVRESFSSDDIPEQKPARGNVEFCSLSKVEGRFPVYNIEVEGEHEYYAAGILVANCEALRYVVMTKPEPSKIGEDVGDKWLNMEKIDRGAAEEWRALDRKRAAIKGAKGNALRDMDRDDECRGMRGEEDMHHTNTKYDWEGGEL